MVVVQEEAAPVQVLEPVVVVTAGAITVVAQEVLPAVAKEVAVAEHLAMEMEEMLLECLECQECTVDPERAQALLRACEI